MQYSLHIILFVGIYGCMIKKLVLVEALNGTSNILNASKFQSQSVNPRFSDYE